ncbi:glycosyltransferase family 2 protein [Salipiger mucosus]|uniref:Glycosyltransferase n=1 Tax=Salipiger mucosus DSM 16094 TaxID=1123237 RepID=S9QMA4_9RHOB|nr:glycosyltransferase family 2 protein [Salipiger mucosus]EPX82581.1 Glycosyltransferase [Salipiger mucosus DSM 16094]
MTALTCIIPAFNEAPRIETVLDALRGHPLIDEVIVVDDGSDDGTADIAEAAAGDHAGRRILRQPENGGKSRAVAAGIEAAQGRLIMLLDADLLGLGADHLSDLAAPVLAGRADVAISLRRNAPRLWHLLGIDYISGERVMPRDLLLPHTDTIRRLPRFGLEVFINGLWLENRMRVSVVHWPAVDSPLKYAKHGRLAGLRADAAMLGDIFRTVPPHRAIRQVLTLRARRI